MRKKVISTLTGKPVLVIFDPKYPSELIRMQVVVAMVQFYYTKLMTTPGNRILEQANFTCRVKIPLVRSGDFSCCRL